MLEVEEGSKGMGGEVQRAGFEERVKGLLRVVERQIGASALNMSDIWEARLYYRSESLGEGEKTSRGVAGALRNVLDRSGLPPGRVVAIPVLAVGATPDVLAGLHLEALAHRC
jgi:hypothetical protein